MPARPWRQAKRASRVKAFESCLHGSLAVVVKRQADIGLGIINDGEYGPAGETRRP
jgi:hypothetical protein